MKSIYSALIVSALLGVASVMADENRQGPPPEGHRPPPPPPPVIVALDANKDGALDAEEITNASAALRTLDANGDGQVSGDEMHPPCPRCGRGAGAPTSGEKSSRVPRRFDN